MSGKSPPPRAGWCFTHNNYSDEDIDFCLKLVENDAVRYITFGEELGNRNTPHLQGYIHLESRRTRSSVSKLFKALKPHLEARKGSPAQAIAYCHKDGKVHEAGIPPKPGTRTDLKAVRELVTKGGSVRDLLESVSSFQQLRFGERCLDYYEKPRHLRPDQLQVIWITGPTGTGKSRYVAELTKDDDNVYHAASTGRWWPGYDAHPTVVMEDFRGNFCTFSDALKIFDIYPYRIEYKGGHRQLLARTFYITSSQFPHQCWDKCGEDISQLYRRIDKLFYKSTPEAEFVDVLADYYDSETRKFAIPFSNTSSV